MLNQGRSGTIVGGAGTKPAATVAAPGLQTPVCIQLPADGRESPRGLGPSRQIEGCHTASLGAGALATGTGSAHSRGAWAIVIPPLRLSPVGLLGPAKS